MSARPQPPTGQVALVTGATSGIGYASARQLVDAGLTVLITGRDAGRGAAAEQSLREMTGSRQVHFLGADHATAAGNLDLVERVRQRAPSLDLLVNNFGGLFPTRQVSGDGVELTVALNLRAAVLITRGLRPALSGAARPRVINVASDAYTRFRGDPFRDVQSTSSYQAFEAYARAKLLLVLVTGALARTLADDGAGIWAVNPGMAWTANMQALTRDAVPGWRLIWPVVRWVQRRRAPDRAASLRVVHRHDEALGSRRESFQDSCGDRSWPPGTRLMPDIWATGKGCPSWTVVPRTAWVWVLQHGAGPSGVGPWPHPGRVSPVADAAISSIPGCGGR